MPGPHKGFVNTGAPEGIWCISQRPCLKLSPLLPRKGVNGRAHARVSGVVGGEAVFLRCRGRDSGSGGVFHSLFTQVNPISEGLTSAGMEHQHHMFLKNAPSGIQMRQLELAGRAFRKND